MRARVLTAAALLALTGCGTATHTTAEPAAAPSSGPVQKFHDDGQAYLWAVALDAPSLARSPSRRLLHAGQDVCNALVDGQRPRAAWATLDRYGLSGREKAVVVRGAVSWLCPGFRSVVDH